MLVTGSSLLNFEQMRCALYVLSQSISHRGDVSNQVVAVSTGSGIIQNQKVEIDTSYILVSSNLPQAKTGYPLSEEALENVWKTQKHRGVTWRDACDRFRTETERIARPSSVAETFPDRVVYEGHCGSLCRTTTSAERVQFHVNLVSALTAVVQRLGKISDAVKSDVLLACEVFSRARQRATTFAFVTAMSAQSGVHPPEQVYVMALPVGELTQPAAAQDRFDGVDLQLCTTAYKQPAKMWLPMQGGDQHGRLVMFTTDEFAKDLLDMKLGLDATPCHVVLTKLLFRDICPCAVRVTSVDASMPPIHVDPSASYAPRAPNARAEEHTDEEEDVGGTDSFDLLSLLADEAVPQPASKSRRGGRAGRPKRQGTADVEITEGQAGDLLADPELLALVGSDELEKLREAIETCHQATCRSDASAAAPPPDDGSSDSQIEEETEIDATAANLSAATASAKATKGKSSRGKSSILPADDVASSAEEFLREKEKPSASASSSKKRLASSTSASSSLTADYKVLRIDSAVSWVRSATVEHGLEVALVERVTTDSAGLRTEVKLLGTVKRMISTTTGKESLQAICKVHKQCMCWLSNSQNLDLLLEWLSTADQDGPDVHSDSAVALKTSLGMRVRARK